MKRRILLTAAGILTVILPLCIGSRALAQKFKKAENAMYWRNEVIATYDNEGRMIYTPTSDYTRNANALESLLNNDTEKTLVIPEGSKVYLDEVLDIGSNTTIIANGAEIIQKTAKDGVLHHAVDGYQYDAIENVTVIGGHWYNEVNNDAVTMFRFIHGSNLTFQNVTIDTNYGGHAMTLVACKDVTVDGCTMVAANPDTKKKDSVEEALQLDIAAPNTAPNAGGGQYTNGQVCQDITVKNSILKGSRGMSSNISKQYPKFYKNYHKNITVENCELYGESSEGLALFNTVGYTVTDNIITSAGTVTKGNHSDGLHIILFGKNKSSKNYANSITGNTIYGKVHGVNMWSFTKALYGKTTAKNNHVYTKSGKKSEAFLIRCCTKKAVSGNKIKKWKQS